MKNTPVIFIFALCPLIPAASNFAYALIFGLAFLWYLAAGIFFREIVKKIDAPEVGPYIELSGLAASVALFSSIASFFFPTIVSSISLYLYVSAFSYLLMISIDGYSLEKINISPIIAFIPFMIFFSAFRELIGQGTITLPGKGGLIIHHILPAFPQWGIGFWATSGGSLILLGLITWAGKYVQRKVRSLRRLP